MSPPSRGRGLKQNIVNTPPNTVLIEVAPLTGAWIETKYRQYLRQLVTVAPLTGAWIETLVCMIRAVALQVAPLTGAWIETSESAS